MALQRINSFQNYSQYNPNFAAAPPPSISNSVREQQPEAQKPKENKGLSNNQKGFIFVGLAALATLGIVLVAGGKGTKNIAPEGKKVVEEGEKLVNKAKEAASEAVEKKGRAEGKTKTHYQSKDPKPINPEPNAHVDPAPNNSATPEASAEVAQKEPAQVPSSPAAASSVETTSSAPAGGILEVTKDASAAADNFVSKFGDDLNPGQKEVAHMIYLGALGANGGPEEVKLLEQILDNSDIAPGAKEKFVEIIKHTEEGLKLQGEAEQIGQNIEELQQPLQEKIINLIKDGKLTPEDVCSELGEKSQTLQGILRARNDNEAQALNMTKAFNEEPQTIEQITRALKKVQEALRIKDIQVPEELEPLINRYERIGQISEEINQGLARVTESGKAFNEILEKTGFKKFELGS